MICIHQQTHLAKLLARPIHSFRLAQVSLDGLAEDAQLTKMLTTHTEVTR